MKNIFPNTKSDKPFLQTNRGNITGALWSTFNIDLQQNPGVIRLGYELKTITQKGDSNATNLGTPVGFTWFDGHMWCIAGTRIFRSNAGGVDGTAPFVEDTSSTAVIDYDSSLHDLVNFNDTLVASHDASLYSLNVTGGTWTSRGSSLSSGVHMLSYFNFYDRLYVSGPRFIYSIDKSWNLSFTPGIYALTVTSDFPGFITCMVAGSDRIWVGMKRNTTGVGDSQSPIEECCVFEWDGQSAEVTKEYKIPATGVMSVILRNDIPIIMDSNGILREYDGTGFGEIGRLPLGRGIPQIVGNDNTSQFIHPKGLLLTENDTVLALICNRNEYLYSSTENINENLPSGIWEFDRKGSATHRQSPTYTRITSTTVTDFGQNIISQVGSIVGAKVPVPDNANGFPTVMCGVEYFTNATTKKAAILADSPIPLNNSSTPEGQKSGYIATTWFSSQEIQDKWERLWAVYKRFQTLTDSIVWKYRLYEEDALQISMTWVNTTSLTTTTDPTAYFTSTLSGEIEILQGTGSGNCRHIVNIVNNSGTYTITLDSAVTGVTTGTAIARLQKWIKLNPTISGTIRSWDQMAIGGNNTRIMIKGCFTWTGNGEFHKFALFSNEDIKINA